MQKTKNQLQRSPIGWKFGSYWTILIVSKNYTHNFKNASSELSEHFPLVSSDLFDLFILIPEKMHCTKEKLYCKFHSTIEMLPRAEYFFPALLGILIDDSLLLLLCAFVLRFSSLFAKWSCKSLLNNELISLKWTEKKISLLQGKLQEHLLGLALEGWILY